MGFSFKLFESDFTEEYITVRTAAKISGYNQQYLRRLLRDNIFRCKRIGQLCLMERDNFINSLEKVKQAKNKRFGPH
jgi:phage antirepressor YoqD-like protein